MKILLIDDDRFLRDMYATKFTECGDQVRVGENGHEALSILTDEVFDVILLDMVMPGMSGIELMIEIRKNSTAENTKCIVLSNQGEQTDIQAATEAGAAGYIIKAESIPSEVVTKVHSLIS
ncbi:MAG: CheY-like chemotaxis protein [Acidimicrobiales bacterium]|jgi:CheY-like chemotaxis protein